MLSKNEIKFLKSLHHKKFRDEEKLFIVEGEKSVMELIHSNLSQVETIFCTNSFFDNKHENNKLRLISEVELAQISTLKTPNKALAVCRKSEVKLQSNYTFILALDAIQDPGNLGTLIRLADWFGVEAIICSENTVEMYNPKVVQAAMGSLFRTEIHYVNLEEFLSISDLPIYGAFLDGENIYKKPLKNEGILVLGNEGNGISPSIEKLITQKITIPKFGGAESLNVAMAGGILLSEFSRNKKC